MKCLFIYLAHILIVLLAFLLLSFKSSLPDMWFANIFFYSVACLFNLLIESFIEQNILILVKPNISFFVLLRVMFLVSNLRTLYVSLDAEDFLIFSKDFLILCCTCKFMIYFELTVV